MTKPVLLGILRDYQPAGRIPAQFVGTTMGVCRHHTKAFLFKRLPTLISTKTLGPSEALDALKIGYEKKSPSTARWPSPTPVYPKCTRGTIVTYKMYKGASQSKNDCEGTLTKPHLRNLKSRGKPVRIYIPLSPDPPPGPAWRFYSFSRPPSIPFRFIAASGRDHLYLCLTVPDPPGDQYYYYYLLIYPIVNKVP